MPLGMGRGQMITGLVAQFGGSGGGAEDGDDRCDLSEGAPHGEQPADEKGGLTTSEVVS